MNLYFDTEFTGLHKNTTFISLGIVDENGRSFYAEFTDYDRSQVDEWIEKNVIANLQFSDKLLGETSEAWVRYGEGMVEMIGPREVVANEFIHWLKIYKKQDFQMVSDVSHYDFVLFIDLFGSAFDLPEGINPACHDINQDIAKHLGITEREAFDVPREELAKITEPAEKHNALWDAKVIKAVYERIHGVGKMTEEKGV